MRKIIRNSAILLLIFMLLLPFLCNDINRKVEAAAITPSLTKSSLEIRGIGETYDINIRNKVAKSTYTWSTSNKNVATVTNMGIVTSIGNGIAIIRCKITYPTKKTLTLSCKVTVTVPAKAIDIKELSMVNNAYQLALNATVDLDAVITPSESSDQAYWYIDQDNMWSDPTCVTLDSSNKGIVTGVKAGKAVVRVRAVDNPTMTAAQDSDIDDAIIIEVIAPTASVKSADIVSSNQLTVVFDSPVQQNTVINTDGTLSPNITVTLCRDTKNVQADDPGKLTASLSTDQKTLIITSAKAFNGIYGVDFSSKIVTTSGIAIDPYYKQINFIDTIAPYIIGVSYDDTGMIATIAFSETIDFKDFMVKSATVLTTSTTVSASSLSYLSSTGNYTVNSDKKSVTINMANIATTDYGKAFQITFGGIKDLAGNTPTSDALPTILVTDNSPRPQAQLISLVRTGYNTLTATFDRSIKTPGYIQINGGANIYGVVDTTNANKVNYTMTVEAQYTGIKNVGIGFWSGYNVAYTDVSANQLYIRTVDFTVETISPEMISYVFDTTSNILTLTYSEPVSLMTSSGTITANLTTIFDENVNNINISYTSVAHNLGNNIIKLKLTFGITQTGYFTFTMIPGFVRDNFNNMSASKALIINNSSGTTELPGPYMVLQSPTNLSEITLMFAKKLDLVSAQTVSNYKIPGVTILSAAVTSNNADSAIVVLTVQSIDVTSDRTMTITGVKGYNNSYSAITSYNTLVNLKENTPPAFLNTPVYDSAKKNVVNLNFSEAIQGSLTITVTQIYGTTSTDIANTVTVSGNCASINLTTIPTNGSYLKIVIISNNITDAAGNKATFATTVLGTTVSY